KSDLNDLDLKTLDPNDDSNPLGNSDPTTPHCLRKSGFEEEGFNVFLETKEGRCEVLLLVVPPPPFGF
ncbi:hypothetical protein, partial [Helicobacter sp. 13S00482-2]|uniref:hypothetical protein n=1 Tax=Helicobacter sp. 13S00482-2 TaxID=1476200 RepID=UPI001C5E0696